MNAFDRAGAAWDGGIERARHRSRAFDHAWRARQRYGEVIGGRLAAAMAYYGFFATFALGLLAYSVLGFVLANNQAAFAVADKFLRTNLPWLHPEDILRVRGTVAIVGLIGLVFTGIAWVEAMRSSQRQVWRLEPQPGNVVIRRLVDLGVLVGLGFMLSLSLWLSNWATSLLPLDWFGTLSSLAVNVLLAAGLLSGVPRLRMPVRRLLPAATLVGVGLFILATLGSFVINRTRDNPAYSVVAGAAGLLVFLYLFSQLLLYGAALAATGTTGEVRDLAAGPPASDAPDRQPDDRG
ncbi:MAG TPA: YhjD/YihY/BrkB family envelope integrity protein [Micromonosporaceae bacterium]